MLFRFFTPCLLCAVALTTSACTETIIREIPASSADESSLAEQTTDGAMTELEATAPSIAPTTIPSPSPSPSSSPESAPTLEPGTVTPETGLASGSPENTSQSIAGPTGDIPDVSVETVDSQNQIGGETANTASGSFADQAEPAIAGEPGVMVDCQLMLPCRWSSDDGALTVTATNADNIAARQRLSVSFTIDTSHDTSLSLGSSPSATGEAAASYNVTEQILGLSNGNSPQALLAGASLRGQLNYNSGAGAALSAWTLALFDNGLARNAMFSNLPVGGAVNADADCAGALPCIWTTTNGDVTVTLISAGGFAGSGRLSAHFSITSSRDRTLAIDGASTATGSDGNIFTSRTHELAQQSGYQRLTQPTAAGTSVPGSVDFFRSESQPDGLRTLMLSVFDDEPSPRWNPVFTNVPVL